MREWSSSLASGTDGPVYTRHPAYCPIKGDDPGQSHLEIGAYSRLRVPRIMSSRKSSLCCARKNLRRIERLSGCIRAMLSAKRRMTARQAAPLPLRFAPRARP